MGFVPVKDGITKIILKRYAPVVRRKSSRGAEPGDFIRRCAPRNDETRTKKLKLYPGTLLYSPYRTWCPEPSNDLSEGGSGQSRPLVVGLNPA